MSKQQMNAMGTLNNRWGVCGFTSSLYALYENSPSLRAQLTESAKVSTRVIAEIKSFLRQLEADGNAKMLTEIADFTRSFEGFGGFTIAEYIRQIDAVAAKGASYAKGDFSIALPPEAVVAYLRYIGFRNPQVLPTGADLTGKNELVLGLADPTGKLTQYGGLCHYVYQKGSTVYTWGRQFTSVAEAGKNNPDTVGWTTCVVISPHG
jgi:hypothetical protein